MPERTSEEIVVSSSKLKAMVRDPPMFGVRHISGASTHDSKIKICGASAAGLSFSSVERDLCRGNV